MTDLINWLRACLDDDERVARAAANYGDTWSGGSGKTLIYPSDESRHPGPIIIGPYGDLETEHTDHITRWDPARVLAEVDAKRRILDEVVPNIDSMDDQINGEWGIGPIAADDYASVPLLRLLALPYADREGYRDEWRP